MFDKVYVAIATNPEKHTHMFDQVERRKMMEEIIQVHLPVDAVDIIVLQTTDVVVDVAANLGCDFLIRGIRDQNDISHERMIYDVNKAISNIETIYIMCDKEMVNVSSSVVRNIIKYSKDRDPVSRINMLKAYIPAIIMGRFV